ncbi:MAG TPA: carotenoid oxygenase family protein [Streptosporangiaceae bacterium]
MADLRPVDPAADPHLSGRFAPVATESDADGLLVEGSLPGDLNGVFMRNGPNPKFPPLGSYTYPLEGDGMIHAVWLADGRARYRNRWVRTSGLAAEERAGRALFGGIMTPAFVDQGLLGPDPDPGWPVKLDAFISIIRHGGRYLALEEGTPPYEVSPELDTIGRFDFGGGLPLGICAHPRIDPRSGELVVFRYDVQPPYLTWAAIGPDGSVTSAPAEVGGLDRPYMIHDFTITEHYAVFVIGPAVLNLDALAGGAGDVLAWQPDLGTRIAVVPRSGQGRTVTAELDAFWAWHFANAYEDRRGQQVIVDFPRWNRVSVGAGRRRAAGGPAGPVAGSFCRATIDVAGGTARLVTVDDAPVEFPRIDDRLTGRRHRYVLAGADSGQHGLAPGEHDRLVRYDLQAGRRDSWATDASIGEVVFAPRSGTPADAAGELDGYYLTLARSVSGDRSWLYVWDAGDFPGPPCARVAIPATIPNGLHANWFPLHRG